MWAMNIETFRTDLRAFMEATGTNAHRLSLMAKVEYSSLYNFLKGGVSLSGANILKLYPFVYKPVEKNFDEPVQEAPHAAR